MIRKVALCFALSGIISSCYAQQRAASASDFVDSVGVNTHFSYTDTTYYREPDAVIAAIQTLGVHHVRDGLAYSWVAPHLYSIYTRLAGANIHPTLVTPNPAHGGPQAESLERLLPNYPGVDAIEAPNEYDQTRNPDWAADMRAYLPVLMQVAHDKGITLIGPSLVKPQSYKLLGDVSGMEDFGNLHAYWGGRNPETSGWGGPNAGGHRYGSFAYNLDNVSSISGSKPAIMTESGYVVADTPRQNVITEPIEAIYEPRLLLEAWNHGIRRTFVYQLIEDPSSPRGIGLMTMDLHPRPAYNALANLLKLLADEPTSFTPGELSYSLGPNSADLHTTLLQKHDGSFWLAVWNPALVYEVDQLKAMPVFPRTIVVNPGAGHRIVATWAFNDAGEAVASEVDKPSATVMVGSAVTLLEIK